MKKILSGHRDVVPSRVIVILVCILLFHNPLCALASPHAEPQIGLHYVALGLGAKHSSRRKGHSASESLSKISGATLSTCPSMQCSWVSFIPKLAGLPVMSLRAVGRFFSNFSLRLCCILIGLLLLWKNGPAKSWQLDQVPLCSSSHWARVQWLLLGCMHVYILVLSGNQIFLI